MPGKASEGKVNISFTVVFNIDIVYLASGSLFS